MENFEFKSQICTTKEQSERLLKLGLKKDIADMVYHYTNSHSEAMRWELRPHPPILRHTTHLNVDKLNVFKHKKPDGSIMTGEEYFQELWGKDIPAWSLHRLVEIIDYPSNIDAIKELLAAKTMFNNRLYDRVIDIIEYLIQKDEFNKDYMEE